MNLEESSLINMLPTLMSRWRVDAAQHAGSFGDNILASGHRPRQKELTRDNVNEDLSEVENADEVF